MGTIKKYFPVFLIISVVVLIFAIKREDSRQKYEIRQTHFFMDTYIEIVAVTTPKDKDKTYKAIQDAFVIFQNLEKKFNFYNHKSYIQWINEQIETPIKDKDLLYLLQYSLDMAKLTQGCFDPTLGALKVLYPIGEENPVPPSPQEIEQALKVSGYKKVHLKGNKLEKPKGLLIDFGGILKGYAVDKAWELMRKRGIKNFIVNGGGNIRVHGNNAKGKPWHIGIENPRNTSKIIGVITLSENAVATSGDYQRYFFYKGKRYHHIIDPKTGYPAYKSISATVIAPTAKLSDALSTAVFVMGREKGISFLEKMNLQGIIIDEKGYSVTKGFKGKIKYN